MRTPTADLLKTGQGCPFHQTGCMPFGCGQVDLPDPEEAQKDRGSVRERRKEDQSLLEMAGRTMNHPQR